MSPDGHPTLPAVTFPCAASSTFYQDEGMNFQPMKNMMRWMTTAIMTGTILSGCGVSAQSTSPAPSPNRTTNPGNSVSFSSPAVTFASQAVITSFQFVNRNQGWAVGYQQGQHGQTVTLWESNNAGATWSASHLAGIYPEYIHMKNAMRGWLAGLSKRIALDGWPSKDACIKQLMEGTYGIAHPNQASLRTLPRSPTISLLSDSAAYGHGIIAVTRGCPAMPCRETCKKLFMAHRTSTHCLHICRGIKSHFHRPGPDTPYLSRPMARCKVRITCLCIHRTAGIPGVPSAVLSSIIQKTSYTLGNSPPVTSMR